MSTESTLRIVWIYPDLLSTYGDRGNLLILARRATLTLALREYKTLDDQLSQLNLSSPDRTHAHMTKEGDTLSRISSRYYLRPGDWRSIAESNDIDDPRRLDPGVLLTVPSIR